MKLRTALAAAVLAAATGSGADTRPASAETLVVAAVRTPGGFDGDALKPATQNVVTQVYEGLTTYARVENADGTLTLDTSQVIPHLAEGWTVSDDGLVYTFTLREGVRSFFGNELTAEDVVFGWEKSLHQQRTGNFIATVSGVEMVEALSPREVRFTLKAPSAIFLRALTNYVPSVYDSTEARKHATADDPYAVKWLDQNTAGFGAYHLEELQPNQRAVFVANPNYFGGKPFYDRVIYLEVPSVGSRLQLLQSGQVQWVEEITHQQVRALMENPRIKVASVVGTSMASARMNPNFEPFDDVRVRRAMALATDYAAINQAVFEGMGTRVRDFLPPAIPGHDPVFYRYDTDYDEARRLLAEAGHPDGVEVTLEYAGLDWWEEPLAIQLQRSMRNAGITVNLSRITDADMRARSAINRRDLPFFTFRDFPFVLDPVYKLFLDAHSGGASNRNDFRNAEFDRLVDEALVEIDPARRMELVRRAQQIHADEATWIYTWYPGHFEAMPQCMRGYAWYPDYHERWKDLRCE